MSTETEAPKAGQVKIYDFRAPSKFSKEQMRTLQMIHESFARRASSALSALLRATVQISVSQIEQGTYGAFAEQLVDWALMQVINPHPLPGRILLEIDSLNTAVIVDRLLGGYGKVSAVPHEPTDIEINIVRSVTRHLLGGMIEAWNNVVTLQPRLEENQQGAQYLQISLPSDAAVMISFNMQVMDNKGRMRILVPFPVIKPILSLLSPHAWVAGQERENLDDKHEQLRRHLDKTSLTLSARFDNGTASLGDLVNLTVGDVIWLDSNLQRELQVLVEGKPKFRGRPGTQGARLAVQITKVLEENSDEQN